MSRVRSNIAKLTVIALGWLVVVATSQRFDPIEHRDVDVSLGFGPDTPTTAVVDVTFEGAFLGRPNAVCAFAREDHTHASQDIAVEVEVLSRLGETAAEDGEGPLMTGWEPITWAALAGGGCAFITCGAEEPCGGRFAITLRDDALPDAGVDPTERLPITLAVTAATQAEPGALPGRTSIDLVETRP